MILKLSSFFTFALAFSALDTANALSPPLVPGSVDHDKELHIRSDKQLNKRDVNVRFTFDNPGLGICGQTHTTSDFVVALDALEFDSAVSSPCFKNIIINAEGKTATAQIVDVCDRGCSVGDLVLSAGLFQFFAPLSDGAITGSWFYANST